MRYSLKAFFLCVIFLVGCSSNSENQLEQRLKEQVVENQQDHEILAQAVLVKHNNERIFREGLGQLSVDDNRAVTVDTLFPIYSVSKLFANTVIYQLYEEGKLDLSKPVSHYLKKLPAAWQDIPVKHFINHSSGVPEFYHIEDGEFIAPATLEKAIANIEETPFQFENNTDTNYNQTNYLILRLLIESILDTSYESAVNTRIFEPLKLTHTFLLGQTIPSHYEVVTPYFSRKGERHIPMTLKNGFHSYSGSLTGGYSTLRDLETFVSALLDGQLVSKSTLLELWQPHQLDNGAEGEFASGYMAGTVASWKSVGHDGGGIVRVRVLFKEDLNEHFLIIYLTNGNTSGKYSSTLVNSLQQHALTDRLARWYSSLLVAIF